MKAEISDFMQKYFVELGRIVVNMNMIEDYTRSSIFILISENQKVSEEYLILFSVLGTESFKKLLEALETIVELKIKDELLLKQFHAIKGKASGLYEKRNKYIHSVWLFAEDDMFVSRMRNRKHLKVDHDMQPSVKELAKLADELSSCAAEMFNFIFTIKTITEKIKHSK